MDQATTDQRKAMLSMAILEPLIPGNSPDETMRYTLVMLRVERAWGYLTHRQSLVLSWYYFNDMELLTIGQKLGVSRERARQIKELALRVLRRQITRHRKLVEVGHRGR